MANMQNVVVPLSCIGSLLMLTIAATFPALPTLAKGLKSNDAVLCFQVCCETLLCPTIRGFLWPKGGLPGFFFKSLEGEGGGVGGELRWTPKAKGWRVGFGHFLALFFWARRAEIF